MKANIFVHILFAILTAAQMWLPIGPDRTMFTYVWYIMVIIGRILFNLKLYGIPVNWKIAPILELIGFGLTMVFFMSAKYKKSFPIIPYGFLINVLIILLVLGIMAFEQANFVYIEKEVDD